MVMMVIELKCMLAKLQNGDQRASGSARNKNSIAIYKSDVNYISLAPAARPPPSRKLGVVCSWLGVASIGLHFVQQSR